MKKRKILIAIGGNSLIKDNKHILVKDQYRAVCETAAQIVKLIQDGHQVVITHGNGPQVGFILHRSELAYQLEHMHTVPLVNCDADTQGAIGYQIQQAMDNEFKKFNIPKTAVTIITQILVDKLDEAFISPSKPIGQFYSEEEFNNIKKLHPHWDFIEDAGRGYRRVVPSPSPKRVVELKVIKSLLQSGFIVIAAGGGGIPVIEESGLLMGIDAVIDKDKASSLLANKLEIDTFIISTGVRYVATNFNTSDETPLTHITAKETKKYIEENQFAKGSMLPKIEAALDFIRNGGREVIITDPDNLADAFFNGSGTHIT